MTIDRLEVEGGAAWRAYCALRDAADHSLPGSAAHLAFTQAHAAITDLASDEGFERFVREAQAAEAAAAKPDQPAPVEHAEAPAAPPRRPLDR